MTRERKLTFSMKFKRQLFFQIPKYCPEFGERNKAEFPDGIDGKIQYGDGIKASIINFLMVQMISLIRVQEHFRGLTGRSISRSVMLKYIEHFAEFLKEWENKLIGKNSPVPSHICGRNFHEGQWQELLGTYLWCR